MNDPNLTMDSPTYIATATPPSPVRLKFDPETLATKAIENRRSLGTTQLCRRDHLHGFGDLLRGLNRRDAVSEVF
jgi:hypothetical protein